MKNSKKEFKELRNSFVGRDAVIVANGPSVNGVNFSNLDKERFFTVGVNAAGALEKHQGLLLDFLCVSDLRFFDVPEKVGLLDLLDVNRTKLVLREEIKKVYTRECNTYYVKSLGRDGFSYDISSGFFFGVSTTIMAIQLAYFLGAKNIYMLGVDLRYKKDNPRFYREEKPQIEDPFLGVQLHNLLIARESLNKKGCGLYICSEFSFARPYIPYVGFSTICPAL
ncbi:6-hydroxymethylpterin diphosphokinase MptE-like protein [Vreelandella piezotolerans]|uniref:6-hydroxymethylpterin diphosphokinase MptE-like protein n=1 Tax=Vreelandella piezotolerans TaxID=2609667 RepID=UPI001C62D999|nr:6-hydroxymethylpterin diphosphokinase MptE-like protein [Halomonas piezotolerans]